MTDEPIVPGAGVDRALSVMRILASRPNGVSLHGVEELLGGSTSSAAATIADLVRAGFARELAGGAVAAGDEFIRLAQYSYWNRPDTVDVDPLLADIVERLGLTAFVGVLDGLDVVYRHRVEPCHGRVRRSFLIGGRARAHGTAIGKMLLADAFATLEELQGWAGSPVLVATNENTTLMVEALQGELEHIRESGFAVDAEESEPGVVSVAVLLPRLTAANEKQAVGISGAASTTSVDELKDRIEELRALVAEHGPAGAI